MYVYRFPGSPPRMRGGADIATASVRSSLVLGSDGFLLFRNRIYLPHTLAASKDAGAADRNVAVFLETS